MRIPEINLPERIRLAFEELGATFVKLGQVLSVRPDVVPPEYVAEFERLQSRVPPFPYEEVRKIIVTEFGQPPESIFRSFNDTPIAAASIAQVHYAVLQSGDGLAVKVQRPGVRKEIEEDIRLLRWLAGFSERHIRGVRVYRPLGLVEEFADWTMRELDFRVEALNADHFRYDFQDDPTVYVPKIYWDLTTARMLTMEFIDGATVDDPRKLRQLGIDAEKLAKNGARTLLKQVFINGFFHGDPHPGNFFALPGNRICYHDFGIVGYLAGDLRRELTSFFIAFTRGEAEAAADHLFHLATPLESTDPTRFKRDLVDIIGAWHYTGRQSLARTFLRILQTGASRRMAFPSALALLGKALLTVESVGFQLYPGFSIDEEFGPFISEVFKRRLSPGKVRDMIESSVLDYAHALEEAPKRFSQVMDTLSRGEISIKIDRTELDSLREELRHTSIMRVLAPLVIVLILASAIAFRAEGIAQVAGISIGLIWFIGAVALGSWLIVLLSKRR